MMEIVVISGKGGTGKTSIAASLAFMASQQTVLADCDVDAADLHLILHPRILHREDFYSGVKAVIDTEACSACDLCRQRCRFAAITNSDAAYAVDPLACEGCGYCHQLCPSQAISLVDCKVGECYRSQTKLGNLLIHARLEIGADNSGKLVARVKKEAQQAAESEAMQYILVDGSPGIGCPVISSLSGADYALIVTEPTLSGLHDLQRVWELASSFGLRLGCIINKSDLNPQLAVRIANFLQQKGITLVEELPYDDDFQQAITLGKSLVEIDPGKWQSRFQTIFDKITKETI